MLKFFRSSMQQFCKLSVGLGSSNNTVISLLSSSLQSHALFVPNCPLLRLSFYFKSSGTSGRNCVFSPSLLSSYNGSPDTRFFRATTRLMSLPGEEHYFSLLYSLVSTLLISQTGGARTHLSSTTHKSPWCPLRNLCFLDTLAVVFSATDTAFCLSVVSLELAESRIFHAAPMLTPTRTPVISFCTIQLRTL